MSRTRLIHILCLINILCLGFSCKKADPPLLDYKRDIKFLVENISDYGRSYNKNFFVVTNDGLDLITKDAQLSGIPDDNLISRISGIAVNGYHFGPTKLNTPEVDKTNIDNWLAVITKASLPIFVTDYSDEPAKVLEATTNIELKGWSPYVSPTLNFTTIPTYPSKPSRANTDSIFAPALAKNYIIINNLSKFSSKAAFIDSIVKTDYDMVIIDLSFNSIANWTKSETDFLKVKSNGKRRLVLSYMSIGQAQTSRPYFQKSFLTNPPLWLADQDTLNPTFYNVKYWDRNWQEILYGTDDSYTRLILKAGFDGVFLDRLTPAYTYWEHKK